MKKYIGSCADDSIGIGTMIIGDKYRVASSGDYAYEVHYAPSDEWIECYDVVVVHVLDEDTDILRVAG